MPLELPVRFAPPYPDPATGRCLSQFLEVIEWFDSTGEEIVHRIPEDGSGKTKCGAQLIVRENQAALFFREGKALDVFGAGRHTLTSKNLLL